MYKSFYLKFHLFSTQIPSICSFHDSLCLDNEFAPKIMHHISSKEDKWHYYLNVIKINFSVLHDIPWTNEIPPKVLWVSYNLHGKDLKIPFICLKLNQF